MTVFTGRNTITTTLSGRPSIANEGGFLLINGVDYLLINGSGDKLIISVPTTGTILTGRVIPS